MVGDFIRAVKNGEPTQAVREREELRKKRKLNPPSNGSDKRDSYRKDKNAENSVSNSNGRIGNNSVAQSDGPSEGGKGEAEGSSLPTQPAAPIVPTVHMVDGVVMINQASMVYVPEAKSTELEHSNARRA
jgi:coproporphyrinogen III oxidase